MLKKSPENNIFTLKHTTKKDADKSSENTESSILKLPENWWYSRTSYYNLEKEMKEEAEKSALSDSLLPKNVDWEIDHDDYQHTELGVADPYAKRRKNRLLFNLALVAIFIIMAIWVSMKFSSYLGNLE